MIHEQAKSKKVCPVLDVNCVSQTAVSCAKCRFGHGHTKLAIRYIRGMGFWNIFGGASKHSVAGPRVMKGKSCLPICGVCSITPAKRLIRIRKLLADK